MFHDGRCAEESDKDLLAIRMDTMNRGFPNVQSHGLLPGSLKDENHPRAEGSEAAAMHDHSSCLLFLSRWCPR